MTGPLSFPVRPRPTSPVARRGHRERLTACRGVVAELTREPSTAGVLAAICDQTIAGRLGFDRIEVRRGAPDGHDRDHVGRDPTFATPPISFAGRADGHLVGVRATGAYADRVDREVLRVVARGLARVYARNDTFERLDRQVGIVRDSLRDTARATAELCDAAIDFGGADPVSDDRDLADGGAGLLSNLTPRQREIFELVAHGASNAQIADRLGLNQGTVKTHVRGMFRRLGVVNRAQAITVFHDMAGDVRPRSYALAAGGETDGP
jgi:DNA-binding CsgD family transcriptional regulator